MYLLKKLLISLSFFTRIPIKINFTYSERDFYSSMSLLPIIGVIIGLILYLNYLIIENFLSSVILKSLLLFLIYVIFFGSLHLDGLADSIDGFLSSRPNNKIVEIMEDPYIGSFGVISLIIDLLSIFLFLFYIISKKLPILLILFPIISRLNAIELGTYFKPAKTTGLAFGFCEYLNKKYFLIYSVLIISLFLIDYNIIAIISILLTFLVTYLIGRYSLKKIKGITGDIIGMTIEISQYCFLLFYIILTDLNW